jgi:hypothetical protein
MFARSLLRVAAAPALAVAALAGVASAAPVPFGGNSYDLVLNDDISWSGARDAATSAGGSLAVISSAAEQSFIESLLIDRGAPTGSYWFGLIESDAEGVYRNPGDLPPTYSNFAQNEPNDAGGLGESVGAIYWTVDGGDPASLARRGDWNDLPDAGYPGDGALDPAQADLLRAGYLIEFAPTATPGNGDGSGSGDGSGPGNGDGSGPGGGDGNGPGGGDGGLGGGDGAGGGDGVGGDDGGEPGNPNAIPIPPALLLFPGTAVLAIIAARRMKR